MQTVTEFLSRLASAGVKLSADGGQLSCYAQPGALTPEIRDGIGRHKAEILAFLDKRDRKPAAEFPLSAGQKGLYILQQVHPEMSAYNVPLCVKLGRAVDVALLDKAWSYALDQFPLLTARVVEKEDGLWHVLDESCRTTIREEAIDLDDGELQSFLQRRSQVPFDLNRGPLTRLELFTRDGAESILLVTIHHIVFDGTSSMVLLRALLGFYQQLLAGRGVKVSDALPGYQQFVEWEASMLASPEGQAHAAYWQQQLSGELPVLELFPDRPRNAAPSFAGRTLVEQLSAELSQRLQQFIKAQAVRPSAVFLAAYQLLLSRYTRVDDVIVGMPVMGRVANRFAGDVGYFINMVPLRTACGGRPSFAEFLRTVQGTLLEAVYHSAYPFPLMLEGLQSKQVRKDPVFQVTYAYQNFITETSIPGMEILDGVTAEGSHELGLEIFEDGASFRLVLKYNPDVYAEESMRAFLRHYRVLLENLSGQPERCVHEHAVIDADDARQLLVDFNATNAAYPADRCFHQLFDERAAAAPDAIAAISGDARMTYAELRDASRDLALDLQAQGIGAEGLVGVCMERSLDMVVALVAILQAGGAYVPLDPTYPDGRLAHMLEDSGVTVVLTQESLRARLASLCGGKVVALDTQRDEIASRVAALKASGMRLNESARPGQLAYVIYTSGSTGKPKGVMIEHRSLVNYLTYCIENYAATDDAGECASFLHLPLTFDASITSLFAPLLLGKAIDVNPGSDTARTFGDASILGRGYDFIKLTPAHLLLLRENATELPQDRNLLVVGGEALTRDHVEFLAGGNVEIINEYGPTEATVGCTTFRFRAGDAIGGEDVSIGTPIANTQIYVLDRNDNVQPIGVPGELHIAGDGLARGYLNRPELTREKFVPNPFVPGTRMYRTGDLARWMPDGTLHYLGRIDTQVKVRGFRIETGEIEARLNQHFAIQDSAVIAKGEGANKQLVAFYRGSERSHDELAAHLLITLPDYMVPAAFVHVETIPLSANGKVDRRALAQLDVTIGTRRAYVAPRNETEVALVSIWSEVLRIDASTIGVDDNFFELGGHSLLATQLVSKVRARMNVELPLKAVFDGGSVAQLAKTIANASKSDAPAIVPVDRTTLETLPLSFAQERLWFIDQLEPESAGYNVPGAVTIRGALDVEQLEAALNTVIARHENLRTVFPSRDGRAQQRILDRVELRLERIDVESEEEAKTVCERDAVTPFDLANGPLLRGKAIRIADDHHVLLVNLHHIIGDGWSLGVLIDELNAIMRGDELPPLPIQYADYAVWQRTWLEDAGVFGQQLAYWQKKLAGMPESLDLATDFARPSVQSVAGATHAFSLDAELTAQLQRLAETHGATLYMALLAAFKVLLHRYTGQSDLCIGSPIANRRYAETERLIGMFVNTLALRSSVDGNDTFDALLEQVKATCLEAYEHQDAPFEKIVDAVRPQRNLAVTPLFQIMFILQNVDRGTLDARLEPLPLATGVSKFDLTLELSESANGLAGSIEYCTALFKPSTIARMAQHFTALCRAVAATPSIKLSDVDYLGADERHQLLVAFNDTHAEYPADVCIHQFFLDQVAAAPDRIAVTCGDESLTYGELRNRSAALAVWLQAQGIGPDRIVGLCMERSIEMMVAIMGTVMAGGAYLPLDPSYPDDRLTYMLEDSNAAVVLTQAKHRDRIQALAADETQFVALDTEWRMVHDYAWSSCAGIYRDVKPRNLCYVIYTSGSTGRPKGVLVEHQALVNRLVWMQNSYPLTPADVVLQKTPYSFDVSVWEFFWPVMTGASIVFAAPDGHKDVAYLESLIRRANVTTLHYVPSMLYTFLDNARGECPSVRRLFCSGEALDRKGVDRYRDAFPGAVLHNLYGPTEAAIDVTAYDCSRLEDPFVPIGAPIANTQIYILDKNNNVQPIGVPGELHIAGDNLARGYLNRVELTREKFVANPFTPGARMYKTGDLSRWLDDGNIQYLGRIDTQVKVRGFRIETGEIEARLSRHPSIQDSAVIAKGEGADKHLVAFYSGAKVAHEELAAHLLATLPEYMVPGAFVHLETIPLSANGKVDRRALSQLDVTLGSSRAYVAPRNGTEAALVAIWSEVLRVDAETIGVNDNFFELGGHSLLATQLVSKIRTRMDVELPLKAVFEGGSVAQLAPMIASAAKSSVTAILPADRSQPLPLSFAQERLWFINQLEPESAGYNVPGAVAIRGALNVDRLEAAFNIVIARHENLRTIFPSHDGQAQQRVLDRVDFRLERLTAECEEEAKVICEADAVTPFDLANGPLIRGKVITLADDHHILMVNLHHIVSDGWSLGVLINELGALMRREELPPLPIQYADYAVWQRTWLEETGVFGQQLAYWQAKLANVPESLDLATDFPRPSVQRVAGATQPFALDANVTARLQRIAEQRGGTLYMALLAAFKTLLHRYTGQGDLCVGSPIANRQYGETEGLIGMFVNTLALRSFVDGDEPFEAVLETVKATCLEAYEHQDAPFERIVDAVRPQRNLAITPLFQVMFILQNADMGALDPQLQPYALETGVSKFDLTFELTETPNGLAGSIEYATALFKPSTIERMAQHFTALCSAIAAAPASKVRDLDYLSAAERRQLLEGFNATAADYPAEPLLHQLFNEQAARSANDLAVVCGDDSLTYAELHAKTRDFALYLQSLGVQPDHLVGLCMERSPDMVAALLAVLQAGGAYVPLDPDYPDERIAYMLKDSRAAIVLTQESLLSKLAPVVADGVQLIAVDRQRDEIASRVAELKSNGVALRDDVTPRHLAYVIYTSGSTGQPKGVAIEHHSPVTLVHWASEVYSREELAGVLAATSICFDLSIYELFVTLANGGTVILVPNALGLADVASPDRVTLINTVPSAAEELLRMNAIPDSVRTINLAGEPLAPALVDRLYESTKVAKVFDLYGPSEDTTYSTFMLREKGAAAIIGRPLANTQVYILDRFHNPQPVGVPGELHISGDGLARGYLHRPELTDQKFVANPFRAGTRMYKTGDLARWLDDGTLQYLGRIDTQVKIRGFRIETGEIEARLGDHPAIQDCAVVAQGEGANKQLVAFYRATETTADDIVTLAYDELRAHLAATLPEYMMPGAFVSLAAIPLSPNGKIDRRALVRMDVSVSSGREYIAPRSETEKQLVEIWSEVLRVDAETIGINDNFFELGGHSLSAVQLMARTNRAFAQTLPLATLFTAPNVAALARLIAGDDAPSFELIVPIRSTGDGTPVFAIPGAGGNVLSLHPLGNAVEGPLYAFDGTAVPFASVEETAKANVAAMKSLQPSGPYRLVGHSYGGVVAYEMARLLLAEGEDVASLTLLDSMTPAVLRASVPHDEAVELAEASAAMASVGIELDETQLDLYRAHMRSYRAYAPSMLPRDLDVALYLASHEQRGESVPPDFGWSELLQGPPRIRDVEAGHYTILQRVDFNEPAEVLEPVVI